MKQMLARFFLTQVLARFNKEVFYPSTNLPNDSARKNGVFHVYVSPSLVTFRGSDAKRFAYTY
jgi:hypothetical protein